MKKQKNLKVEKMKDLAMEKITHVLFLGLVEYRDPKDNEQVERLKPEVERFKGRLFRVEDLPEGFELAGSILGVFLEYKGFICSRGLFCYDGGWFNWSHNKPQTPEEFVREHNEAEKFFAEQYPEYEPEFITFQGHAPGPGGSSGHELAEVPKGPGADEKREEVKNGSA